MIETILLIVITLFSFGTAKGEYPSTELKNAHKLVSCIEKDADSMNAFHLAMLKVQGTTKSKSEYHNLLTLIYAAESNSYILSKLIANEAFSNIEQVVWMCRKEIEKR